MWGELKRIICENGANELWMKSWLQTKINYNEIINIWNIQAEVFRGWNVFMKEMKKIYNKAIVSKK